MSRIKYCYSLLCILAYQRIYNTNKQVFIFIYVLSSCKMVVICNIVLVGKLDGISAEEIPKTRKRFNGVKISLPKSTCLLFRNGAVTIVGVKSLEDAAKIPGYLACMFPNATLTAPLRIVNIVGTTNAHSSLKLRNLYQLCKNNHLITYTPETFPGMKITLRDNLVAIVFHTGKIVLTGAKSTEDLLSAEVKILDIVKKII